VISYAELAQQFRYPEDPVMQELYVQTFEFNPACTLEIGWHIFGENYERGEFLVRMREQLRSHGIAESCELPDHLCHILPLLDRLDSEEAAALVGQFVLPALAKVKDALNGSAYHDLVVATATRLEADYPDAPRRPAQFPIFQEAACE
jgi:nitrate reductase assembly molybdenum cofactor insertion protein NarJ